MKKKKKLPNGAFLEYFDNIAKEKRIDREVVINAIKEGFETAYTKKLEDETKAMFNTKNKKTNNKILVSIPSGTKVKNYGYFGKSGSTVWLYIQFTYKNIIYTGFASKDYLQ